MGLYIAISVIILVCCIFLGIIVLIQNPKGGGLSQTFGGGNQFMGARKTADFLEKATWVMAIALCVLSIISSFSIPDREDANAVPTEQTE
ncbi:MAG: preprotein translocase subunit SecG [Bacteroidales bacterium]|jgi:preprotein translocase subunit SecG|nr:preprotein translocase subunit SecG [Bacteroidales bacterium]